MDFGEIDVQHVVGRVVVADLTAGPVQAFDFDGFVVVDFAAEGDYTISKTGWVGCVLFCMSRREYHQDASDSYHY